MGDCQLAHKEIKKNHHAKEIILISDGVERPANMGGLLRTAESFGVKKVIFFTNEYRTLSTKMKRVSRSAENYIDYEFKQNIAETIQEFKSQGYGVYALEKTKNSIDINTMNPARKIVLICGNEKNGIQPDILHQVDGSVHINFYGATSSLNVVVATGIALNYMVNN